MMYQFSSRGQKWLKGFHLFTAACWVGGALALFTLYFLKHGVTDGGVLHGIDNSIHHVDIWVIVLPGAIGCLVTGLLYALFTKWGFFKHKWLTIKWIVTVSAILFGTFYLGPWGTAMMDLSGKQGIAAIANGEYLRIQQMHFSFGALQLSTLVFTVFISSLKPWKKKNQ